MQEKVINDIANVMAFVYFWFTGNCPIQNPDYTTKFIS
jgi:hypothetical protein